MKKLQTLLLALTVGLLTATFATSLQAADKAPDKPIVIDGCKQKKPPVTFNHQEHLAAFKKAGKDVTCKTCHHTGDTSKACTECHKEPQGKMGACTEMSLSKNPFHKKCITCHKEMKKEGFAKAPTSCTQCHKK